MLAVRVNVELPEPTVAPAVEGLRGSLPRAEDSVLLFLVLSNSGVDFLCSGGRDWAGELGMAGGGRGVIAKAVGILDGPGAEPDGDAEAERRRPDTPSLTVCERRCDDASCADDPAPLKDTSSRELLRLNQPTFFSGLFPRLVPELPFADPLYGRDGLPGSLGLSYPSVVLAVLAAVAGLRGGATGDGTDGTGGTCEASTLSQLLRISAARSDRLCRSVLRNPPIALLLLLLP